VCPDEYMCKSINNSAPLSETASCGIKCDKYKYPPYAVSKYSYEDCCNKFYGSYEYYLPYNDICIYSNTSDMTLNAAEIKECWNTSINDLVEPIRIVFYMISMMCIVFLMFVILIINIFSPCLSKNIGLKLIKLNVILVLILWILLIVQIIYYLINYDNAQTILSSNCYTLVNATIFNNVQFYCVLNIIFNLAAIVGILAYRVINNFVLLYDEKTNIIMV
jgi:hypothetical protein